MGKARADHPGAGHVGTLWDNRKNSDDGFPKTNVKRLGKKKTNTPKKRLTGRFWGPHNKRLSL